MDTLLSDGMQCLTSQKKNNFEQKAVSFRVVDSFQDVASKILSLSNFNFVQTVLSRIQFKHNFKDM